MTSCTDKHKSIVQGLRGAVATGRTDSRFSKNLSTRRVFESHLSNVQYNTYYTVIDTGDNNTYIWMEDFMVLETRC